jgi:DNA-binding XRE family transcriptional regulator
VEQITEFKKVYNQIVTELVQCRNSSKQTQDDVAKWVNVSRKKIIEFENLQRFDIDLMCNLADKFSIEINLKYKVL